MLASASLRTGWSGVGDTGGRGRSSDATVDDGEDKDNDDTLRNRESSTNSAGRRKWSTEEIHELMFCYYKAKVEGAGFIKRLEKYFKDRNPHNIHIHLI